MREGSKPNVAVLFPSLSSQTGVSLSGLVMVMVMLGVAVAVVVKIFPVISEYMAVNKAIVFAKEGASTPAEIRSSFDRQANIQGITSLSGKDLEIVQVNGVAEVSFAYQKKIPLAGPASLLIDYRGSTAPGGAAAAAK